MTDANAASVAVLVDSGLGRREARWLVEEFGANTEALRDGARRRRGGEPLQYIIGHWPFRSLDLNVDERALIPRPETEELVSVALGELLRLEVRQPIIVDLGCGSGAIGLALLDELRTLGVGAKLVAVDESTNALALAQENAVKHELTTVTFVHSSWFDDVDAALRGHVDLIVANPPYVGGGEFEELDHVLRHEPKGAIVAEDCGGVTGFADLETIITQAPTWLQRAGVLVCEHANTHRDAVLRAAERAAFSDVRDVDDVAGHPRVLVARR